MPSFYRRPAVWLALGLCSVGAVVTLLGRLVTGTAVAPKKVEISTEAGAKAYPAFSPDGAHLVYSARGTSSKDDTFHILVRDMPSGAPRQLTDGPDNDVSPVWSPDGAHIAFLRISDDATQCVVMSASAPKEMREYAGCSAPGEAAQPFPALAWMHDGHSLVMVQTLEKQPPALALLALDSGAIKPLTHPPAGTEGDSTPAVSPDGATLAFVRGTTTDGADILVTDFKGTKPHPLTFDNRLIHGIAWTKEGQDIVYCGERTNGSRVWRVQAFGGSPREFMLSDRDARFAAVAPAGNRLVYTVSPSVSSIWRASLGEPSQPEHVVIRTNGRESCPRYSPDGKRIADISDQTGNDEVWVCDADGENRVQVTNLKGPELMRVRWSPDSKSLIFAASSDHGSDLYTAPATASAHLTRVQLNAYNGSFSHDGKSIYFQSENQLYKSGVDGGNMRQLTQDRAGAQPVETTDGKYVYFRERRSFWRVPTSGGDAEEAIIPEHDLMWSTTLQLTPTGAYYLEFERSARQIAVSFYDFETKKSDVVFRMKNMNLQGTDPTFSVSPDGKSILFPRVDQSQTNLVIVENFR